MRTDRDFLQEQSAGKKNYYQTTNSLMSVYNTTLSDCDYVFPFNSVSDDDNVFGNNNASDNCCTNINIDSGSSLDNNFESFQYTEYSNSDYDRDLDPVNNLYNRVLPSCKYYDDLQFNVITKNNTNGLSMIHFNARCLNANFHSIIHTLQTLNITFDIIAISETWTESNVTTEYDLPHYQVFHKARHYKKGGGVALYVNDRIDCTLIESKSVVVENMFECVTV